MTKPKQGLLLVEQTRPGHFTVEVNSQGIQDATPAEFSAMVAEMVDDLANEPGMQPRQKDKSAA